MTLDGNKEKYPGKKTTRKEMRLEKTGFGRNDPEKK
jgi:hypothetical protein